MPSLRIFGRRTLLGGDDLQIPSLLTVLDRVVQLTFLLVPLYLHICREAARAGGLAGWLDGTNNNCNDGGAHRYFPLLLFAHTLGATLYTALTIRLESRLYRRAGIGTPTERTDLRQRAVAPLLERKLVPVALCHVLIWSVGVAAIGLSGPYYACRGGGGDNNEAASDDDIIHNDVLPNMYPHLWWYALTLLLLTQFAEVVLSAWAIWRICSLPKRESDVVSFPRESEVVGAGGAVAGAEQQQQRSPSPSSSTAGTFAPLSLPYALVSSARGYGADFVAGAAAAEAVGALVVLGDAKARSLPDELRARMTDDPADPRRLVRSLGYVARAFGSRGETRVLNSVEQNNTNEKRDETLLEPTATSNDDDESARTVSFVAALAEGHALLMAIINAEAFDVPAAVARVRDKLDDCYLGPSTAAIVAAATDRRIPHIRLNDGNLVQLGHGQRQRRIWTAETDMTSAIAEGIAGDKDLTKSLLKSCGVPVPEGQIVNSPEEAWEAAQDIGLPVVSARCERVSIASIVSSLAGFHSALPARSCWPEPLMTVCVFRYGRSL